MGGLAAGKGRIKVQIINLAEAWGVTVETARRIVYEYAALQGLGIGVVAGSFVSGALVDRLGDRNATRIALGVALLGTLALAVIVSPALAWPLVALFGLAYGTYQAVYFALAMEHTDPRIAASMFSILMAVTNVAQGVGMGASGALADAVGFRATFLVLAALNLLALPLMPRVFRKTVKR